MPSSRKDAPPDPGQRQPFCTSGGTLPHGSVIYRGGVPATPRAKPATAHGLGLAKDESVIASLLRTGFLSESPMPCSDGPITAPNDLDHVKAMFCAQVPGVTVAGVYRIRHEGHKILYRAVQDTMESKTEYTLWHGTPSDSVRNIALNGFNRNYCGRHGMKLGVGTYFSSSASYSVRFCSPRTGHRFMFLAKVLVGAWTKGTAELREPPFRDNEGLMRYDSTVDDIDAPKIFCAFRDYQALPLYVLEFSGPA